MRAGPYTRAVSDLHETIEALRAAVRWHAAPRSQRPLAEPNIRISCKSSHGVAATRDPLDAPNRSGLPAKPRRDSAVRASVVSQRSGTSRPRTQRDKNDRPPAYGSRV